MASIKIRSIWFDSGGPDDGSNASLNDEYIRLENNGSSSVNIGGWMIRDAAGNLYTFPAGFRLAAGASVPVHTGRGHNTARDLYWNRDDYVWNNQGDTARLRRPNGVLADRCTYSMRRGGFGWLC
jgi:hypothetical protein